MSEELQNEVIETDFKERAIKSITVSPDSKPAKFLRDCAKAAKENNVKSVMVMVVTEGNFVDYNFELFSEHHMALMALTMEDAKDQLKAHIFPEAE